MHRGINQICNLTCPPAPAAQGHSLRMLQGAGWGTLS